MKKYPWHNLLFGLCVVFMLGLLQACTDPVSIDDEALDTETTASLQGADNSDKAAGSSTNTSADPPKGDYTDPNRPGLVIICHIPSGDDATPVTLSIPPSALADYSTSAGDYDGPCAVEDQDDDVGSGDEGNDDQDDPNAPPIGNDDEGDDDGSLDGDYADTGRPGQVIICHVPSNETEAPRSLSVLPSAVASHVSHPNDYDGPCREDNSEGEGSGDQGSDDQDDANAAPVSGGNEEGNEAGTTNNGRDESGG